MDSECARCHGRIGTREPHTEIVRRDVDGDPQPSKVEYLCEDCLEAYEEFLSGSGDSPHER